MDQKLRVAYLVGTSHCGSTLLSFVLNGHPEIFSTGETGLSRESERNPAGFICSCGSPITSCAMWNDLVPRVQARGLPFSVENWTNAYHYHNRWAYSALTMYRGRNWGRVQRAADGALPWHRGRVQLADRVNGALIEESLAMSGKQVFFDGTKILRRLQRLMQMPQLDVQVIRVYRDARAYVHSMKKFHVPLVEAATHWLRFQQTADELLQELPAERVLEMRFEDFCREPDLVYRRAQEFLGVRTVALPEKIVPREHHVMGNDVRLAEQMHITFDERWRRSMSDAERAETLRIVEPVQTRLGYET